MLDLSEIKMLRRIEPYAKQCYYFPLLACDDCVMKLFFSWLYEQGLCCLTARVLCDRVSEWGGCCVVQSQTHTHRFNVYFSVETAVGAPLPDWSCMSGLASMSHCQIMFPGLVSPEDMSLRARNRRVVYFTLKVKTRVTTTQWWVF